MRKVFSHVLQNNTYSTSSSPKLLVFPSPPSCCSREHPNTHRDRWTHTRCSPELCTCMGCFCWTHAKEVETEMN